MVKKLVSNKFKIGDVEIPGLIIQGPMAGVANEAFRLISKKHGAALVCSEMVSIEGLRHKNEKSHKMISINQSEHPASLQLFGNDVEAFVKATKLVDQYSDCDIIDLNLGCPAPKVAIRSQSGSQLLKTPKLIGEIVEAVVANTTKPVTAKIRLGWDKENINAVEVAKIIEAAGASAITVHGRTRSEFYTGKADWQQIKAVKEAVKIPVIGNGDVLTPEDAKTMLEETGCDAVMISRGSQGNPWIFAQCNHYLATGELLPKPSFEEWKVTVLEHLDLLAALKGDHLGLREFRKHLNWYWDVLPKTKNIKAIKDLTNKIETRQDVLDLFMEYQKGLNN
ncbi:nifR3 family TIM-barrel protein [Entomoplasma freundtii]|uniref:tRNA-dihydrouridine synthase n=2 Tax=Entomoplasma freundtii TaxID=74700 RepID=A0A2K8NS84_9MOLU|nr:tRNA-dihydrouridine synthase B [Entomoplasma freundtii]TDY58121.1 nifR3 family TIM-barrel protein [Entomoplasma freundtii]